MANRLEHSSSAYLHSAAHQPIDWHEFGEAAFQLAKELDRPILLDIGAVWCHWCHVIDRESYENDEIASLINQYYVAVKVDRDQRPDVDARYQQVVQAFAGQGGWPLTGFLTYDGRLIYGGTYFPPNTMKGLLMRIHELYQEKKSEIFKTSQQLDEDILHEKARQESEQAHLSAPVESISSEQLQQLCKDFLETVHDSIRHAYDIECGGFGKHPKFLHFSILEWLTAHSVAHPDDYEARAMLEKTLTEMARGGVYDQIAGGFHRYSVDERWHVPHFEKMAYDNAEAIKVYAQAYRLTGNIFFREVAEGIINWVNEWLCDTRHGGFYASQDADIDLNDDGDHFTWSLEELAEILTPEETDIVCRYYDIDEQGDMHHAMGRNVLMVTLPTIEIAHELSLPIAQVETLLASAQVKMMNKRRNRSIPFIDKNLYTNWNGMMLAAYFEAADLLDLPDVRDFARKSLDRILAAFYQKGEKVLHTTGIDGFLEDYAWLAFAALQGYASTANEAYLQVGRDIANIMVANFEDPRLGGFYDLSQNGSLPGLLKMQNKPIEDNPSSSANAVALRVLLALNTLLADAPFTSSLEKGLNILIHLHGHYGLHVSALALVAQFYRHPPLKLEVLGTTHDLQAAARQVFAPGKLLAYQPQANQNEIRPCFGTRCLPPVLQADQLPNALALSGVV